MNAIRMIALACSVGLIAGCASVVQATDRNVIVKHGLSSGVDAVRLADAECQKHGKRAKLDVMNCPYACLSQFRCE